MAKFISHIIKSKYVSTVTITSLAIALSGCITVNASSLDYKESKTLSLNANQIKTLDIDAAAGFLIIEGDKSISTIEVMAYIEAYDEDIKLTLESNGDRAILVADASYNNNLNWSSASPKIDLTIKIPSHLSLNIKDGSGSIEVSNISSNIQINDGSGSMLIKDIKGDVKIQDGSGSSTIKNVDGNVKIDDGSGSLMIQNITGSVNVEDGSGSMDIYDIGGLVTIDDGSGNIDLKRLKNGLTIIEEGSGGLQMSEVVGPISIK